MPKLAISLICLLLAGLHLSAMQVDTVYFDKEWTIMDSPHFAHYYRVLEVGEPEAVKHFRDYYITGEMYEDGKYVTFDKADTYRFVKQGEWTRFYKSGSIMEQGYIDNGKSEGTYTYYYENGSIRRRCSYLHNLRHGVSTDFTQDGLCIQREYQFDVPTTNYFTVSDENGFFSKVNAADKTPIWESPDVAAIQSVTVDDDSWMIYANDGITLSVCMKEVSDYGNYYRLYINLTNNSFFPVTYDPAETMAILTTSADDEVSLQVQTAQMYNKRIRRTHMWEELVMGFIDGLGDTERSSSYSFVYHKETTKNKQVTEVAYHAPASAANVFGNSYIRTLRGANSYYGTKANTTYNSESVLAIQSGASAHLCLYSLVNAEVRRQHIDEYLKPCVIDPGKSISGYINVKKKKGDLLNVCLTIENAEYNFPFQFVPKEIREKHRQKRITKNIEKEKDNNFNKVYFKYEKLLNDLAARDNGEFEEEELQAYRSNFTTFQNWFEKEASNFSERHIKKWDYITSLHSKRLKRLNFIE